VKDLRKNEAAESRTHRRTTVSVPCPEIQRTLVSDRVFPNLTLNSQRLIRREVPQLYRGGSRGLTDQRAVPSAAGGRVA
jgi:hypothetical protein